MLYNQNLPELLFPALFLQFIMDFQDRIREYREGSSTQSLIWIWFEFSRPSLQLFLFEEENKVVAKSKLDKIVLNHVDFSKNRIVL